MTTPFPANIRVNASFPFPATVGGSGPVTLSKASGIWTIGLSVGGLPSIVPPPTQFPVDYLLVYNDLTKSYYKLSLADLQGVLNIVAAGSSRAQRAVTASPIVITSTDQIINCNIATAATCILPAASSRAGVALTFKDLGQASAHNITITPSGGDTIDGLANYKLVNNYAAVTLVPFADGVNAGWMVQ